jgi:tRNA-2-methylthio-N6-dimethylallyladenosine synthase
MLSEERAALEELKKTVQEETERRGRPLSACVVTFGCQMNERDSEKLKGILLAA